MLTPQQTFYTQGLNPFRILADASGTHIFVLDHDAPDGTGLCVGIRGWNDAVRRHHRVPGGFLYRPAELCAELSGDAASGSPLTYFPVPADPIDFTVSSSTLLTLSGTTVVGDSVFPYAYNAANGQLSVNQNSSQPLGMHNATALVVASSVVYVLDNGVNTNGTTARSSRTQRDQMARFRHRPNGRTTRMTRR